MRKLLAAGVFAPLLVDGAHSFLLPGLLLKSTRSLTSSNHPGPPHAAAAETPEREPPQQALDKTPSSDLLKSLDDSFTYDGRLPSAQTLSSQDSYRCGFVCIVGAPNMGKSTLTNALLEEDLCVATRRPQTTRHAILGVLTTDSCQLCLVDTPGIIDQPAYKLQEGMMEAVMGAFHNADVLVVVTDCFSTPIPNDDVFARVRRSRKPTLVVVNKMDLLDRVNVELKQEQEDDKTVTAIEAVARWRSLLPEALAILPVSASGGTSNAGVAALRHILLGKKDVAAALRDLGRPIVGMFREGSSTVSDMEAQSLLPPSPPLYDKDTLTDRPERFFASEMIRASLFRKLRKELPYCCEVRLSEFKESSDILRMKATVFVERDSQKMIVVGKGGETIKGVGIDAREHLEDFFQKQVYVELLVKVDKDWRKNEGRLKELGYLR